MNARLRAAGYYVDYLLADSKGNSAESIRGMTDHYRNGTLAFIGPENTCMFEARVAAAWNLPMIGFVSRGRALLRVCQLQQYNAASAVFISKASRTGNKVSCQPNDCPNR